MGSRGSSMYNSSGKRQHYGVLLLLALGAAMLSVLVVHKLREGRVLGLILQDREHQLLSLQMILQREKVHSKEMKNKIEELRAKAVSLRSQKIELNKRLTEAENLAVYLKNKRAELESALEEKQNKLASLKDTEEASTKANLRVAALTDLLKQQQDHTEQIERRLQQPSSQPVNATVANDVPKRKDETDESSSKEAVVADRDDGAQNNTDGAKQVENSEHEQGSKGGQWVRLETNNDDGESGDAEEEDHGKEQVSEDGKQSAEGIQVDSQNAVEVEDENQNNRTELLQISSTSDGELPVMKDEVTSSNTTETNVVASEDGKADKKDDHSDGEEKRTTVNTETSPRGRRTRRSRTRGRKRRSTAKSWEQNTEASKDSQAGNSQHEESSKMDEKPDNHVFDGNATEVSNGEVQAKQPEGQTAEQQSQVDTVSLEASAGSNGDENSESKSASLESYQDTNGSEENIDGDNKNGSDGGEQQTDSSNKESSISEGVRHEDGVQEIREENSIRSTLEAREETTASDEGQTETSHGTEEGESSGKRAEGNEQSATASEEQKEKDEGDEENKPNALTASIQQQDGAAEVAEDGEANDKSQPEQEAEAGNLREEKPGDESKAEVAGVKSENEEDANKDEDGQEDVKEF